MEESPSKSSVRSVPLAGTIVRPSDMIKSVGGNDVSGGQSLCDNQSTAHKRFGCRARKRGSGGTL